MTTDYPLGRIAAPDERDHRFLMTAVLEEPYPLKRSISYRRGPILDQGATSSCVGHGWRAWLNGAPIRQVGGPRPLDIYHSAQDVDEWEGSAYEGTSVRAGAKVLAARGYIASYVWAFDEATMRKWLLGGKGGVVIGVNWYSEMFRPDAKGFVRPSGPLAGGHCVWVRGYNRPRDAYRIQNSWNSTWGDNGQAWIQSADMARLIGENGEVCCGIEARGM
jgi:hypothetical protein